MTVDVDDALDESQLSTYVCSNRLGVAKVYQNKHVSTRMQTLKSASRRRGATLRDLVRCEMNFQKPVALYRPFVAATCEPLPMPVLPDVESVL